MSHIHHHHHTVNVPMLVTVLCESCGTTYMYKHGVRFYRSAVAAGPQAMLDRQVQKIQAGDCSAIADHKPCPQCGYVQSWMECAVRRQRGFLCGAAAAAASLLFICPAHCAISALFSSLWVLMSVLLIYLLPVIIFFVGRAVAMSRYQPNKNRDLPVRTGKPSIGFAR